MLEQAPKQLGAPPASTVEERPLCNIFWQRTVLQTRLTPRVFRAKFITFTMRDLESSKNVDVSRNF